MILLEKLWLYTGAAGYAILAPKLKANAFSKTSTYGVDSYLSWLTLEMILKLAPNGPLTKFPFMPKSVKTPF